MADEQNQNSETQNNETLGNQPEARNPDGSLKETTAKQTEQSTEPEKKAEPKAEGDEGKKEGDKKEEPKKPEGAPEKYEAFKVPEGYTLDEKVATEAQALFKEADLTQDMAQKFVDLYSAQSTQISEKLETLIADTRAEWRKEIAQDKTIGNGTDNLRDEVKATIGRAIDGLGDQKLVSDFRAAMNMTGAGDHPAFVRAFYKLAQQVTEAKPVTGKGPAPVDPKKPISAAQAMFPDLPSAAG
jgi:hypothetical protein